MDEFVNLLFNPSFQLGTVVGAALAMLGFLAFICLAEVHGRALDRRQGNTLDEIEHFQRTGEAIRYGMPHHAPSAPEAANDATLDLRDAYRRPRSQRSQLAELRSGPR